MSGTWFGSAPATIRHAAVPPGTRVYAVGDIHGRADLLRELVGLIREDARAHRVERPVVVYLGDYIDRGRDSRQVIEFLLGRPLPGFEAVHLLGNHERAMLDFLDDIGSGLDWLWFGGRETLMSYGIALERGRAPVAELLLRVQAELNARLPPRHLAFLKSLVKWHLEGDYLFVHAGIRPGVPLERQSETDLIWIREEFLASASDYGRIVVHGHTISAEPELRANRIGIDTGAFATGRLTCLALEGEDRAFLCTRG
ncbi:MAG: metallophosphoesterase family protein [Pseudomonadota bacterium]